jgi:tRNA threonylcarbamoyladenosine biosynthesis protein TsaB
VTRVLVIDTATVATVVGVALGDDVVERRHDPAPGERPGHVTEVLGLVEEALAAAGTELEALERIAVGVGPGSFTGLRIGLATARGLALASGRPLAAVSTLGALAVAAAGGHDVVLAVLDARRGEAFVGRWEDGRSLEPPRAIPPADLAAAAAGASLAVGDGAIRFREQLEAGGVQVPPDESPLHRVGARGLARLAETAPAVARERLVPEYVRAPDARPR